MGAYLSKPITEKISSDESNEFLKCGASSMQGWRVNQEDAHNTCLNFDKNRSLFAVYDGHGGSEVANYTASKLPEFIKKIESYQKEQFSQALTDAFLAFDAFLIESEALPVLKELAGTKEQEDDSDYDGEEVDHLCREASMPLEEVMAKYAGDCSLHFQSPILRPKRKVGCSSSSSAGCSSSSLVDEFNKSSDVDDIASKSLESSCCSHLNESTCSDISECTCNHLSESTCNYHNESTCSHLSENTTCSCHLESTCSHLNESTCSHLNESTCSHLNESTCSHLNESICSHLNKCTCSSLNESTCSSLNESTCSHLNENTCNHLTDTSVEEESEQGEDKSLVLSSKHSCPHIEEATSSLCNGTSEKLSREEHSDKSDKNFASEVKQESKNDKEIISKELCKEESSPSISKDKNSPEVSKEEKEIREQIPDKEKHLPKLDEITSKELTEPSSSSKKEENSDSFSNNLNGEKESPIVNGKIKDEGGGKIDCNEEQNENSSSHSLEKMEVEVENGESTSKDVNGETQLPTDSASTEGSSTSYSKGDTSKGKGKGNVKGNTVLNNALAHAAHIVKRSEKKRQAAIIAEQIYKHIKDENEDNALGDSDEEEDDDEEDDTFKKMCCHHDELSSDEDESENEDDDAEEEEEEEEEEDDDDDVDDKCKGVQYSEFPMNMREEPGYDSGCTACVAFLNDHELYVANVGDSRCVVSRNGKALDMSVDHKPEDEPEAERIRQAGGRITNDGRVNGGLNLSRALGDHSYKQNKSLRPEAQMISPLPDVRSLTLTPEDSFMVIACDGIWNSMSSQDVVDFVNERLELDMKLSKIAEEMFDHCLSPDAHGDGTGCDNMTCIIIKFKSSLLSSADGGKRSCEASEPDEASDPQEKRCRLEAE